MAIPALPTVTTIVTEALKRAGRVTPSATQIQSAIDTALQEVKSDIMFKAPTHRNLLATSTAVTMRGQQRYFVPEDYNQMDSITMLDGPDDWRGLATAGTANTITLASSLSVTEDDVVGRYILLTDGPGFTQYRQITNYTPSTKLCYVDVNWDPEPTGATSYLIVSQHPALWPLSVKSELDKIQTPTQLGRPYFAVPQGQEFWLYPVPDKGTYGIVLRYYVDLSMLDETGLLFVQLLREWRSLWLQGVAVKSMQRYDEDRYVTELGIYNNMLDTLASHTATVRQMRQED